MKKKVNFVRESARLLVMAGMLLILTSIAFAQSTTPTGPNTLTRSPSTRFPGENQTSMEIQAKAGNVTALVFDQRRVTQAWQGYYGNVTGTITLDDSQNMTLYDWALTAPAGEIYASNFSTVDWNRIYCMNVSHLRAVNGSGGANVVYSINGSQIELDHGINATDFDGLNETFNDTYVDTTGFRVGSVTIDVADGCSLAHPYTDESVGTGAWQELLLSDNASLVFTTLLRNNANGFQTGSTDAYDFQMLVLEDGHVGSEAAITNYYFFIELT